MLFKAVDALSGEAVLEVGFEGVCPGPVSGDLLVTPDKKQYRVLQRAYIAHIVNRQDGKVLDFSAPKTLDFALQFACCPVGMESEYASKLTEG